MGDGCCILDRNGLPHEPGGTIFTTLPRRYRSYEEAINAISSELANEDEDDRADDLMCLGDLYMKENQPLQAIPRFKEAYEYYDSEYGEDASETLEAQLSLAEAYKLAGNSQESSELAKAALNVLKEKIDDIMEDMKFVDDDKNDDKESLKLVKEALELVCDDLVDVALLGGWAYVINGDETKSKELYKTAEGAVSKGPSD